MLSSEHYSDEEMQSVIDNVYRGNKETFELHLRNCDECNKKFLSYLAVQSFLKYNVETPKLEIDLAEAVLRKATIKGGSTLIIDKIVNWLLILTGILIIIICIKSLIDISISPGPIALFILFLFSYTFIALRETYLLRRKFQK